MKNVVNGKTDPTDWPGIDGGPATGYCSPAPCTWDVKIQGDKNGWRLPYEAEWANMTEGDRRFFFRPHIEPGIVALDACTAFSHIVNCYVLNEE